MNSPHRHLRLLPVIAIMTLLMGCKEWEPQTNHRLGAPQGKFTVWCYVDDDKRVLEVGATNNENGESKSFPIKKKIILDSFSIKRIPGQCVFGSNKEGIVGFPYFDFDEEKFFIPLDPFNQKNEEISLKDFFNQQS